MIFVINGKVFKQYRGMGSLAAMSAGSAARYGHSAQDTARKVAADIGGVACPCDITDSASLQAAIEQASAAHGPARILMSIAGIGTAKRVVGNKVMGGQSSFLPLKVNYSGVMPVIFASAILLFPQQIFSWLGAHFQLKFLMDISNDLLRGHWTYYALNTTLILFFSYFWVSVMFKPIQIADDLKKYGGYIPGVRPGEPTAQFLDFVMTRLTLAGAILLTLIAVMPDILLFELDVPARIAYFFGGTGMLITVGVILDTMRQIETFLLQRHYDGFLKKGRIRARSASPQGAVAGEALSHEAVMKVALPMLGLLLLGTAIAAYNHFLK